MIFTVLRSLRCIQRRKIYLLNKLAIFIWAYIITGDLRKPSGWKAKILKNKKKKLEITSLPNVSTN